MKILVINGPNLNMLGIREPDVYGKTSYGQLCADIEAHAAARGVEVELYQSNHDATWWIRSSRPMGRWTVS